MTDALPLLNKEACIDLYFLFQKKRIRTILIRWYNQIHIPNMYCTSELSKEVRFDNSRLTRKLIVVLLSDIA